MVNLWKNKRYIIMIFLVIVLVILILSKDKITELINNNIKQASIQNISEELETNISYEVKEVNGEKLSILIRIEDKRGIETIQTEDTVLYCNGKEKIALDRIINEEGIYQFKYKVAKDDKEELCTIVRRVPNIIISKTDTFGDKTTKTIEIEYIDDEKLINYYSLDNGKTWQEYKGPLEVGIYENRQIIAKYEAKEGRTIQSDKIQYVVVPTESLLYATKNVIEEAGYYRIAVLEEEYYAHVYVEEEKVISDNIEYGDENDIATQNTNAKNMIIVKVNGDLTINQNVTLTTKGNIYGGPKGMLLYVAGKLTNNGTITMSQKGAKAEGENIYLWKNKEVISDINGTGGEYEYVPAVGSEGGTGGTGGGYSSYYIGNNGNTPNSKYGRTTGGGGRRCWSVQWIHRWNWRNRYII